MLLIPAVIEAPMYRRWPLWMRMPILSALVLGTVATSRSATLAGVAPQPLDSTTASRERYADLPGVRLFSIDTSGSGIPVVFLHAGTGSSLAWEHQLEAFTAAGYRVIAPDRRGYGRSTPQATGPQPGNAADDLDQLMQHLHIDRFHLVSTAAGGFAAFDYAVSYPARLRSLVVANSIGGVQDEEYLELGRRIRPPQFEELPVEFKELSPAYRAANAEGTRRWLEITRVSRQAGPPSPPQAMKNRLTFRLLETITVPTFLLTGDADLYVPPPVLRLFADRIKHAETEVIAEAGHSSYWEQPDHFNRSVLAFLRKH